MNDLDTACAPGHQRVVVGDGVTAPPSTGPSMALHRWGPDCPGDCAGGPAPTGLRAQAGEGGAACLAVMLGHFGRFVPPAELRVACADAGAGSTASDVLRAARSYGLAAEAVELDLDALVAVRPPMIVLWEFRRFLVVEGFERRWRNPVVHVNDPWRGRRTLSMEEFAQGYPGVALLMSPGEKFRRRGRRPRAVAGLLSRVRGTRALVLLAVLVGVLLMLSGLARPALDHARGDRQLTQLVVPGPVVDLPAVADVSYAPCTVMRVVAALCITYSAAEVRSGYAGMVLAAAAHGAATAEYVCGFVGHAGYKAACKAAAAVVFGDFVATWTKARNNGLCVQVWAAYPTVFYAAKRAAAVEC